MRDQNRESFPLADLRRTIEESLRTVSDSTEALYLGLAETYPGLIRELDSQLGSEMSEKDYLTHLADQSIASIQGQTAVYGEQKEESRLLIVQVQNLLTTLETLQASMDEIREDSVQMELISLNALVGAAKAGNAGKGFSCITTELKQLSSQTMELTDVTARLQTEINNSFSQMKGTLQDMDTSEQGVLKSYQERILALFTRLKEVAGLIAQELETLRGRSDEIKKPIMKIIVEVQNQDRIRQGIDQVFLLLKEFPDEHPVGLKERLDEYAFWEIIPGLCRMILEEIDEQIEKNILVFSQALGEANAMVEKVEAARQAFLVRHLESQGSHSILHTFDEGQRCFSELKDQLSVMSKDRQSNLRHSHSLQETVIFLADNLKAFGAIIEKFRNIDMASRIEVARYVELIAIKDNTLATSQLTAKISKDVQQATHIAKEFSHHVADLLTTYSEQFQHRMVRAGRLEADLQGAVKLMADARQTFVQSLKENSVLTGAFLNKLANTKNDLDSLNQLRGQIRAQYEVLETIKNQVQGEKVKLLGEKGANEWAPHKDRLQAIIDRFTIFVHKQKAAELADYQITSATPSGDVTLF